MAAMPAAVLEAMMHKDGVQGPLEAWDWRYYSEMRRKADQIAEHDEIVLRDQPVAAGGRVAARARDSQRRRRQAPGQHLEQNHAQ